MAGPLGCKWHTGGYHVYQDRIGGHYGGPSEEVWVEPGPDCGAPAEFISCKPLINTPTCAAHKCRCARRIQADCDMDGMGGE